MDFFFFQQLLMKIEKQLKAFAYSREFIQQMKQSRWLEQPFFWSVSLQGTHSRQDIQSFLACFCKMCLPAQIIREIFNTDFNSFGICLIIIPLKNTVGYLSSWMTCWLRHLSWAPSYFLQSPLKTEWHFESLSVIQKVDCFF